MAIIEFTDRVGVVQGGTNLGAVRIDDDHVLLIDSGLNDSVARKAERAIHDQWGSTIVGVLTTHAHADHFGAHAWIRKRTGASIVAPRTEAAIVEAPMIQPALLFGGALPPVTLRGRFLEAEACHVDQIIDPETNDVLGVDIKVVPLPGHSINQFGYLIDSVFFAADAGFPEAAIEKYRIPYIFGLTDTIASLDVAADVDCTSFVPGHGPCMEVGKPFIARNRRAIETTIDVILDVSDEPGTHDDICGRVFRKMGLLPLTEQGYYLLRPTIAAYLAHLLSTGLVDHEIQGQVATWRRSR